MAKIFEFFSSQLGEYVTTCYGCKETIKINDSVVKSRQAVLR